MTGGTVRIGALASGRGSNVRALCEAQRAGELWTGRLAVVVTDKPGAGVLAVAREFGVEAVELSPKAFPSREAHEAAVIAELRRRQVDLVCLAGYMRIMSPVFVEAFRGRAMNIHPALLPAFPGLHAQRQALAYGAKVAGVTVHFVDEGTDTGPVIAQAAVPVKEDDTEASLSARILEEEHRLYPLAVSLYCAGRLHLQDRRVRILPA